MTAVGLTTLNEQLNRFGLWCVGIFIATTVVSLFLPLDVPDGFSAEHAVRVEWLNANRGMFILGWINQIAAMFSLSGVLLCSAWHIVGKNPLLAILAALFVFMSIIAFIIPKFIAVWTLPLLADTIATGAKGADLADPLLRLLNVSIPFSLYTSFDYLGFWLYSVFALLAAAPLYGYGVSTKIASISLGVFGLVYQVLMVALFLQAIVPVDIDAYFLSVSLLLLIHVVAMAFVFKKPLGIPE